MKKLFFVLGIMLVALFAVTCIDVAAIQQFGTAVLMVAPAAAINTQGDLKNLLEKRGALARQMNELHELSVKEDRGFTEEESGKWSKMETDISAFDERIKIATRAAEIKQGMAHVQMEQEEKRDKKESREDANLKYKAAFRKYIVGGLESMSSDERNLLRGQKDTEERALTTQTPASGGYTIPEGFVKKIEVALKSWSNLLNHAGILQTAKGNDIPWPTANDTDNIGALLAENTTIGSSVDPTFSAVTLKAYKFSSKPILVPYELLEDNEVDLESVLAEMIGTRIGRIMNTYFTTGTGTGQPQGIVTGSADSSISAAAAAITFDNLIDLLHSVNPAYRMNAKYMLNDNTLKALKKLKDGQQRPIWLPGYSESEPSTILGKQYVINDFMADIGASAKSVLFGDLSKFKIRLAGAYRMRRLNERYADTDQVAYIAYRRADSKMIDAGTNPVKYLAHAAS